MNGFPKRLSERLARPLLAAPLVLALVLLAAGPAAHAQGQQLFSQEDMGKLSGITIGVELPDEALERLQAADTPMSAPALLDVLAEEGRTVFESEAALEADTSEASLMAVVEMPEAGGSDVLADPFVIELGTHTAIDEHLPREWMAALFEHHYPGGTFSVDRIDAGSDFGENVERADGQIAVALVLVPGRREALMASMMMLEHMQAPMLSVLLSPQQPRASAQDAAALDFDHGRAQALLADAPPSDWEMTDNSDAGSSDFYATYRPLGEKNSYTYMTLNLGHVGSFDEQWKRSQHRENTESIPIAGRTAFKEMEPQFDNKMIKLTMYLENNLAVQAMAGPVGDGEHQLTQEEIVTALEQLPLDELEALAEIPAASR